MKHRFFLKLLASFLVAGLLPAVLLSLAVNLVLVDRLRANLGQEALTAGDRLAAAFEAELERTRGMVARVADSPDVKAILEGGDSPDSALLSRLSRLLADVRRDAGGLEIHVAGAGFSYYATSALFPEIHRPDRYADWGLLRRARLEGGTTVFYPTRVTSAEGNPSVLSAARYLEGKTNALWIITDLSRDRLYRQSGLAGQTLFQEVLLADAHDTVVLDLKSPSREDGGWGRTFPAQASLHHSPGLLTLSRPLAGGEYALEASVPLDQFTQMARFLQDGASLVAGLSLLVSLILAWALSRTVSRPVSLLVASMARVEAGDFSARLTTRRHDELGEAFHRFNAMVDRLVALLAQTKEEQRLLRISESKALQAQINPHFLYNTLNSIKALATEHQADDIRTLVVRLGKLLRSTIDNRAETETVAECLDLLKVYLEIENLRFGGKFTFVVEVDPSLMTLPIPRLLLQPLIENALVHGLETKRGPGVVTLRGTRNAGEVRFTVTDDGVGIAPARLDSLRKSLETEADPGGHVGLRNVHRRLVLLFGEGAGLTLESPEGQGTTVTLAWEGGEAC